VKYHVVTTMNKTGWEETGRRMAQSFVARWPETARLTIYAEGFEPDVDGLDVRTLPSWVETFKARYGNIPASNGHYRGAYDYRFDAVKFSHKAAALTDFGSDLTDGVMIWLDADTFTHADVTEEWLERLFPSKAYIAWLDRRGSHPETGFVMFRCEHHYHRLLMESFRNLYTSGDLFKIGETHDAAALAWVVAVKMASGKIPPPASLSGDPNWHHPFVSGPLGACLDHMKGPRKTEGRSRQRDLRKPRSEPYWQAGN
jgi:hypothetical protein